MNAIVSERSAPAERTSRWHRLGPVLALVILAPVCAEVLPGFTRITALPFALLPEIGIWGCGALLIRDLVRRRGLGWPSLLLLGVALAIVEEFVIQQTSLAPMAGLARVDYGRVGGVNLVYGLWALGFESVWVVVLPVQLTEILFPSRRHEPWLTTRGIVVSGLVFGLASLLAWFQWTQYARVQIFHMPPYQPPALAIVFAVAAIGLLGIAAIWLGPRREPDRGSAGRTAPAPWLVGLAAFGLALPWFLLVLLALLDWPTARIPFWLALAAGLLWAGGVLLATVVWSRSSGWEDAHRLALVTGALVAAMLAGLAIFLIGGAGPVDLVGKVVLDVAAVVLLVRVNRRGCPATG
jgi:hypothetical protein